MLYLRCPDEPPFGEAPDDDDADDAEASSGSAAPSGGKSQVVRVTPCFGLSEVWGDTPIMSSISVQSSWYGLLAQLYGGFYCLPMARFLSFSLLYLQLTALSYPLQISYVDFAWQFGCIVIDKELFF